MFIANFTRVTALTALCGWASAQTLQSVSYTATSAFANMPFSGLTTALPQFDPALGSLVEMDLTAIVGMQGSLGIEHTQATALPAGWEYFLGSNLSIQTQVTSTLQATWGNESQLFGPALSAYDSTTDFAGTSGTTLSFPNWTGGGGQWGFPFVNWLDAWTGTGTTNASASAAPMGFTQVVGMVFNPTLQGRVQYTVRYFYTHDPVRFCKPLNTVLCPCGPFGNGNACQNSVGTLGAALVPSGASSLANDTLALAASGMPSGSFVMFIQGTNSTHSGAVLGDGVLCVGGTITRLGIKLVVGGAAVYPGVGDPAISVAGQVLTAGTQLAYQAYYRDGNTTFCTPATFNLTGGVRTRWQP